MKLCQNCGQLLAEGIMTCPACGGEVVEGRKHIDDYRIVEVLHEGHSSILCKALKEGADEPVIIRIFTPQSGVDEEIADRLKRELEELKKLPEDYFVRHFEVQKSNDGLWYRVSEWIDVENWGNLLASGRLRDYGTTFRLFYRIASILEGLHQIGHFIPHLILNDILVFQGDTDELRVKIDYKLSRFLDPQMDQSRPMLKKLLACHPDIINNRPLDFRSDIWSLGKVFVEILSADYETGDFHTRIEELSLPDELEVLLKIMLADDPDLRHQSMKEVALTLSHIQDEEIEAGMRRPKDLSAEPAREIRGLKRRISILAIIIAASFVLGLLAWLYFISKEPDNQIVFGDYANKYAGSVAFVVAEYWIKDKKTILYSNRTEGTAFLVDMDGHLLTNRHVACPWLEDDNLSLVVNSFRKSHPSIHFGYRIFLWFEGQRAFKRLPDLSGGKDIEDLYFLDTAFRTDGKPGLTIVGVAKAPEKTWQKVKSPLKDDFAVLKIDTVPENLKPLPLDRKMDPRKIPRLSPVMALGFPLGSQTQEATVNVSVTRGHVRRSFENLLQVDSSVYRGNSGGPIIDIRGKVIGIASGVAVEWAISPLMPVATLLSDMGMVLPITKAVAFIQDLDSGNVKWNGVIDLSIEDKLKRIFEIAVQGCWEEAGELVDKNLETGLDPEMVLAAGIIHFCNKDYNGARHLFNQALSMDESNDIAKLMIYLIDWERGKPSESPYRRELLNMDWRSPNEFFGYLVRILEGAVDVKLALKGGYNEDETNWLNYVAGIIAAGNDDFTASEGQLREVLLSADQENWLSLLALSRLKDVQRVRMASFENTEEKAEYKKDIDMFSQRVKDNQRAGSEGRKEISALIVRLKQDAVKPEDKRAVLKKLLEIDGVNGDVMAQLAFYNAMDEIWDQALEYSIKYLAIQGRETAGRLKIGLLESEILHIIRSKDADRVLEEYLRQTKAHWYREIAECLLSKETEQALTDKAGKGPEYLVTAYTALGFWAEGSGDRKKAIVHYREALGSYMDDMLEYEFALERIKSLKKVPDQSP